MKLWNLPFTLFSSSFCHKPALQTVSNACLKSMNAQKSFDLFALQISIRLCSMKRLSVDEKPLRKPACEEWIISHSSMYLFSLLFSMDVNSLPKQLNSVIGL